MIMQSLVTTFVLVIVLIAAFGHVLLLQAMFAPRTRPAQKTRPAQADERRSRHAPVTAARVAA
jgi:Na+-transporting methylmalonyl-CoA/oxaloacetate decarboxylase gamma subunit